LVVEAEAERQRQLVRDLEFVVDPRSCVRLSKSRVNRDGLIRILNLPQQERRDWIARRSKVVAVGVEPGGTQSMEVELPRHRSGRPPAEREVVVSELEAVLDRLPAPDPREIVPELPAVGHPEPERRPAVR